MSSFSRLVAILKRFYPALAFLGGFLWDALTLGRKVKPQHFWQLGALLIGAALIIVWMARRDHLAVAPPDEEDGELRGGWRGKLRALRWEAPYLLLQFCYGNIFSALFILYFKSSGHFGTAITVAILGGLLVGNEFMRKRYGQRFTLTWGLFGLNAILLLNFALPHAAGSLNPVWFYVSTVSGALLAHGVYRLAPGSPGRILPAWGVACALLIAWHLDMIAPVPLVKRELVVGHEFAQRNGQFTLQVERAPVWQFWRDVSATAQVPPGEKLYGVSAVFAPLGVGAPLEHRWEARDTNGNWHIVSRVRFQSSGGREKGFRGYSWVSNPAPGDWRLVVATQDGRTIGVLPVTVVAGQALPEQLEAREY